MGAAHPPEITLRIAALVADVIKGDRFYRRCAIHHRTLRLGTVEFTGDVAFVCPRRHTALWWEVYDRQTGTVVAMGSRDEVRVFFVVEPGLSSAFESRSFARPAKGNARVGFIRSRYEEIERAV